MFAAIWLRELANIVSDVCYAFAGWAVIAPMAILVPKRRDWIAVIGRENGCFLDNTKYFFIQAATSGPAWLRVVHITSSREVHGWITDAGLQALHFPSPAACWYLARCSTVVVDSIEWSKAGRYFFLVGARKIQLWHGVGFKRIELDKWRNEAHGRRLMSASWVLWARLLRKRMLGRIPCYAAVVTTSAFYRDNVFKPAFRAHQVLTTGYPRNCFGLIATDQGTKLARVNANQDVMRSAEAWRQQSRMVVLVVPTFRDTRATPLGLDAEQQVLLNDFCEQYRYEFLFKFHPYEYTVSTIVGPHLHVLDAHSDTYPLFPYVDAMVTDYSSIYMDFLLLDRPVLFFTPDLEDYVSRDRDFQFDFQEMTPGPKLKSWNELLHALRTSDDVWQAERAHLRQLAFCDQPQSEATERLLAYMIGQGWIGRDQQ